MPVVVDAVGPGLAAARRAGHRLAGARLDGEVQAGPAAPAAPGSAVPRRGKQPQGDRRAPVRRTSLPRATGVQQARVDSALRTLADEAARPLSRGWADAVREAARSNVEHACPTRSTGPSPVPISTWPGTGAGGSVVRVLQWLLVGGGRGRSRLAGDRVRAGLPADAAAAGGDLVGLPAAYRADRRRRGRPDCWSRG